MTKNIMQQLCSGCLALVWLLAGCTSAPDKPDNLPARTSAPAHSHSEHKMSAEPDELGRRLYTMEHPMDSAMLDELRRNGLFPGATNEQAMLMMERMAPNYTWYASDAALRGSEGILILVHGFGDHGDRVLREQMLPTGEQMPVSFAFGMTMMMSDHIQLALDELTAAGARDIVIIPAVSTRHNTLKRQWDYVFGLREAAAYASVPRVSTDARLHFAQPLEDHPLVGAILVDYAAEISRNPANEEVIIVGHGPVDPVDNRQQLEMMENLADYLREAGDYAAVHVATLQDDAPAEVRGANVRALRQMIDRAGAAGRDTLVVTNLLGTRVVQSSLRRDLRGLTYRPNFKGLIEHPKFIEWINVSVQENLATAHN